jgi:hypothetical protein
MGSTAKALEPAWAATAMPSLGTLPRLALNASLLRAETHCHRLMT